MPAFAQQFYVGAWQLHFIPTAPRGPLQVLLKFNGLRSFTNRVLVGSEYPDEVFPGGYVSLFGRNNRLLGSRQGIDFVGALTAENMVVLPSSVELDAFK